MTEVYNHLYSRGSDGRCDIYDWNWRVIRLDNFAKLILKTLQSARNSDSDIYNGSETNSALMGIELNNPNYRLTFTPPDPPLHSGLSPARASLALGSDDYDIRSFKPSGSIVPLRPSQGPPRRTMLPLPCLVSNVPGTLDVIPELIVSRPAIDTKLYNVQPRFTNSYCYARGHKPLLAPKEADDKLVEVDNKTDIIFNIVCESVDSQNPDDEIRWIEVTIKYGDTLDYLVSKIPDAKNIEILDTVKVKAKVNLLSYSNDSKFIVQIEVENPNTKLTKGMDLSFVINSAPINKAANNVAISFVEWYRGKQSGSKGKVTKFADNEISHIKAESALTPLPKPVTTHSLFDTLCFAFGHYPSTPPPRDSDSKLVVVDSHGTDVIFQVERNLFQPVGGDHAVFILGLKVSIPLGTSSSCLFCAVPDKYDAQMVRNIRWLAFVRGEKNNVVVELIPKSRTMQSLLANNTQLSFMVKNVKINKEASDVTITVAHYYKDSDGKPFSATGYIKHVKAA